MQCSDECSVRCNIWSAVKSALVITGCMHVRVCSVSGCAVTAMRGVGLAIAAASSTRVGYVLIAI